MIHAAAATGQTLATTVPDEAIIGAAVVVLSWVWPYLVDLVSTPETEKLTKRFASKVYSWIIGSGAVWAQTWLTENPGTDLRAWAERGLLLFTAIFGAQALTHTGHKMTEGSAGRVAALHAFVTPDSIDELAPGDKIPRKLKKQAEAEEMAAFLEWQMNQGTVATESAVSQPPAAPVATPTAQPSTGSPEHLEALRASVEAEARQKLAPPQG